MWSGNGSKLTTFTNTNFTVIRMLLWIESGFMQKWYYPSQ